MGITTRYYLVDGLSSTLAMTDSFGTTIQSYNYDAFGTATPSTGAANEFQFAGEQTDPSGLQYLRARSYDPTIGRFISRDSFSGFLSQTQSLNRFVYTGNNPIVLTDPSGNCFVVCPSDIGHALSELPTSSVPPGLGCGAGLGGTALDIGLTLGSLVVAPELGPVEAGFALASLTGAGTFGGIGIAGGCG